MRQSPNLKEMHKLKRFDFALDKILWTRQWHRVIFSDEKKFNLDGPDGFKYYWHHVNKEEISYSKRIQDGGGIMVWASFCSSEQLILQIVSTKMNSTSYCKMLETPLLAFIEDKSNNINDVDSDLNYIFQQDNAPCHRARATKIWFENNNIDCMNWPPLSPDLNPVENLWADMSRMIYRDGRQYNNTQNLQSSL